MRTLTLSLFLTALIIALPVSAMIDMNVTEHFLPNGMKILAVERHAVPVVTVDIYYRAGSIDEQPGKTGMAHYCEHMMFKSTKNLKSEAYARLMGAAGGGHTNANTYLDRTCYHATFPPDRLELVIRLEAERMANLQPTREEAEKELNVVLEELRLNYMDDPMGQLRMKMNDTAYHVHPYKTLTIGWYDDVFSFTYDDLMQFQRKFYVPNRAVAIVVGDFDTDKMLKLMEQFFSVIPSGPVYERTFPQEPLQTGERRFELKLPVQRRMFMAGYKAPEARHPDSLALEVLAVLLSRGGSSPLGQLAFGENAKAMYSYAYYRATLDPNLFTVFALPLPSVSLKSIESEIDSIISNIRENGVTEDQLQRARTQILSQRIYEMQSSLGIATALGEAEMVNTWQSALDVDDRLAALTPAMIHAAAVKYLVPEHCTVGTVKSIESTPATAAKRLVD